MPKCKNDPKKSYSGNEPSPKGNGYCAHAESVGKVRKGTDGKQWIVRQVSSGSKRWVRTTSKKASRKFTRKPAKASRKSHTIIFTEPVTYMFSQDGIKLKVTDAFYRTLLRKPRGKRCEYGNAYMFGPKFPLASYRRKGYHGNDAAQIGFIDVDQWDLKESPKRLNEAIGHEFDWNNYGLVRTARKGEPALLWFGETMGGDVGADLYVHTSAGKIDGIIVDNNCYFPQISDEEEEEK